MSEQLNVFDLYNIDFAEPFAENDESNEQEEDVSKTGMDSIGEMAISGTDWTTETIVRQIEKGNIILDPDFQRRDAWTYTKKSRFIESLLLGFPIPQIILAESKEKRRRFIVIDGKQRLLSLQQFMQTDPSKPCLKLTGLEVRQDLNGKTFKQMSEDGFDGDIDSLSNQPIRTVVVKNWPSVEVLYLIFLRLNTGSVKLSPQELRQALYPGMFINFANEYSSKSDILKRVLRLKKDRSDFRMRDVEIFIRFMAFQFFAKDYNGSMQSFLDNTCKQLNKQWDTYSSRIIDRANMIESAGKCIYAIFGNKAFYKYKNGQYEGRINRAIMDVLLYYFADESIRTEAEQKGEAIKNAFEKLCTEDEQFMDAIEQTTKSKKAVSYRFNKWAEILGECLSTAIVSPWGKCE